MFLLCKWFGWWCAITPTPIQKPVIVTPVVEKAPVASQNIQEIVDNSKCGKYYFKDREPAPKFYLNGIARTYAQAKCDKRFVELATAPHSKHKNREGYFGDVMYHYGIAPTLPNVFTLLLGLGMRESSGRHCCGKDTSTSQFQDAEHAEAGLWQTSYNAISMDPNLKEIFNKWEGQCHLEHYSKGVKCSSADWKYWGSPGPGLEFQKKAKTCPSFHAHFTIITMRRNKDHFGPFWHTRKVAEFVTACQEMFQEIDKVVQCE